MNREVLVEKIEIKCPDCGKVYTMTVTNAPNGIYLYSEVEFWSYIRSLINLGKVCEECSDKKWGKK